MIKITTYQPKFGAKKLQLTKDQTEIYSFLLQKLMAMPEAKRNDLLAGDLKVLIREVSRMETPNKDWEKAGQAVADHFYSSGNKVVDKPATLKRGKNRDEIELESTHFQESTERRLTIVRALRKDLEQESLKKTPKPFEFSVLQIASQFSKKDVISQEWIDSTREALQDLPPNYSHLYGVIDDAPKASAGDFTSPVAENATSTQASSSTSAKGSRPVKPKSKKGPKRPKTITRERTAINQFIAAKLKAIRNRMARVLPNGKPVTIKPWPITAPELAQIVSRQEAPSTCWLSASSNALAALSADDKKLVLMNPKSPDYRKVESYLQKIISKNETAPFCTGLQLASIVFKIETPNPRQHNAANSALFAYRKKHPTIFPKKRSPSNLPQLKKDNPPPGSISSSFIHDV